jgi:GNAT superfamily N-acetyltransferase
MLIRPGNARDAKAVADLIASFQQILTLEPGGAGAEQYLASVCEEAERQYLESPRYEYLLLESDGTLVGFIAMRDKWHLFHLFVTAARQRSGIARTLWEQAQRMSMGTSLRGEFTVNSSLNAVPVYRSFGFEPSATVVHAHGIAFLPMQLSVENAGAHNATEKS